MDPDSSLTYNDVGETVLRAVIEHVEMALIILDPSNQRVVFVNSFAKQVLGVRIETSSYAALSNIFHEGLDKDAPTLMDLVSVQTGGEIIGYSKYQLPGGFVCILFRDITEKRRLESIAEAVNLMDQLGYAFSGIRHELGNPINSIKMTLSVLKNMNWQTVSQTELRDYIERMNEEIKRVEYLLRSLKSFSMYEQLDIVEIELNDFIHRFLDLVLPDLKKRNIIVRFQSNVVNPKVKIDPRALHQVMLNLVTNAADALDECSQPEIILKTSLGNGFSVLEIRDNGVGMTEEQIAHLFQPFRTTKRKGSGLGLMISKKMLLSMNCEISIQSQEGIGTIVQLVLPQ
ncbi:PAS domain-containing protein [bacterium]|nr:PAS domain-containing protein [bacterium]